MNGRERMNLDYLLLGCGSDRAKSGPTPKQDKWKDPFYAFARGKSPARSLFSHKVDSIRESVTGNYDTKGIGAFFKSIGNAVRSFFGLFSSRKGIA